MCGLGLSWAKELNLQATYERYVMGESLIICLRGSMCVCEGGGSGHALVELNSLCPDGSISSCKNIKIKQKEVGTKNLTLS